MEPNMSAPLPSEQLPDSPSDSGTSPAATAHGPKVAWWHLHRRLYDWVLHWADTPLGGWALFIMSFAESSFFPVPPDVLLMPLVLGNRKKWLRFAGMCSIASILGGILGYAIGIFLWAQVGGFFHDHVPGFGRDVVVLKDGEHVSGEVDRQNLEVKPPMMKATPTYPLTLDGGQQTFAKDEVEAVEIRPFTKVGKLYETYNFWIVAAAGFTPLPFKVITISAGVFKINFLIFCIASAASRSARFFLVAGLMGLFGPKIKPFIDKYFNLLCAAFLLLLIGGFAAIKYIG
jgi:membrane protein YqaA with SNARE-associated domain